MTEIETTKNKKMLRLFCDLIAAIVLAFMVLLLFIAAAFLAIEEFIQNSISLKLIVKYLDVWD